MRWELLTSLLAVAGVAARRPLPNKGQPRSERLTHRGVPFDRWTRDGPLVKQFENANTTKFAINGTGIPDVDFDIGEAYAGRLSIHHKKLDSDDKMYFWFQPSPNPDAKKEIVIWLNGGPGCSSLEGFLQENGPFLWQYGTLKPVPNPWGWHHLTNILWIEQPIDTGFSTGKVTANNEDDVAKQLMGFYQNFVDTFSLQGYKVYITGESYAGLYCPYIASNMLDAKDKEYFDVKGMMIYDPVLAEGNLQDDIVVVPFADYHYNLMPFNDSFVKQIHETDKKCGYKALREKYLNYPPPGHLPSPLPGIDPKTNKPLPGCEPGDLFNAIQTASLDINPCWDVYQVATTCPLLYDVLGFPGSFDYLPEGGEIYFNRPDVKKAINAPVDRDWSECGGNVFVDGDSSDASSYKVLPNVIDKTKNVIIGHGALDFVLIANGTLLSIQNMTFGGKLGFQKPPVEPFYVPFHNDKSLSTVAGAGVFGTTHTERGLTYVGVSLSGHMIPQYAPSAAFRQLEKLLGRVDSLSSKQPFTTDPNVAQPKGPLGRGTAPPGYNSLKPCKKPRNV